MTSVEKKVMDLGSYKTFDTENCIADKLKTLIVDEGGLRSPISISVVIPTKMDIASRSELEIEHDALHKVLSECGHLVDAGYIDEILIMDATQDEHGDIDYTILRNVVEIAYEELELFREQVHLLRKFKIENEKAKRGIYPFCFKVVHQFDRNIEKILAQAGFVTYIGSIRTLSGKGTGLWLSIPICHGDIITFVDSDIINFKREFITGLSHPIIYSWNEVTNEPTIKMTKAYYNRLTVSSLADGERLIYGGRTTRLFARPIIELLTKSYGVYEGLNTIKYPLSGEFSACRTLLEKLEFPNNYAIEMSSLFQVFDLYGPTAIANIDFEDFYHIGQSSSALNTMVFQIMTAIRRYIPSALSEIFSQPEFLEEYERIAKKVIRDNEEHFKAQAQNAESEMQVKLTHDSESDFKVLQEFKNILASFPKDFKNSPVTTTYLPSWNFLREQTKNYEFVRRMLSRRATQSTWTRCLEKGYTFR
ncbi:MAG: hypothetical protein ACTSRW_11780 [Candidatus Helarchaeota archaeon]